MTEIALRLTASTDELLGASTAMLDRAAWWERRLMFLAIPTPLAFAGGLGVAWLMGYPLGAAGLVAIYTALGGAIGTALALRLHGRRYRRLFARSTLRAQSVPVTLSEAGLAFGPRDLPWTAIGAVSRWRQATLLHFSAVDALVIPDRDLPPDLPPAALTAQVNGWRLQ